MIQVTAHYELLKFDLETIDHVSDALMGALMLDDRILQPDLAVSLTDKRLEIWLLVDVEDPFKATSIGTDALATAFVAAGLTAPNHRVFMHNDLLSPRSEIRTELVPT